MTIKANLKASDEGFPDALRIAYGIPDDAEVHWEPAVGWQVMMPPKLEEINITFTVELPYEGPKVYSIFDKGHEFHAHTNNVDTGMPHDTLVEHIDNLEERMRQIYACIDEALGESAKTPLALKRLNLALRLANLSSR